MQCYCTRKLYLISIPHTCKFIIRIGWTACGISIILFNLNLVQWHMFLSYLIVSLKYEALVVSVNAPFTNNVLVDSFINEII